MMPADGAPNCIACGAGYLPPAADVYTCPGCGLLYSGQTAGFGNAIRGMHALAQSNYRIVAEALSKEMALRGAKILDVGSAEGGFTAIMLRDGADCLGIEPDQEAARDAVAAGLPVELMSFEDFVGSEKNYDAIVFNDVFEHMQDPLGVLEKSSRLLKPNGCLLINAPVSTGFIFRVVKIAATFGLTSPYARIWARGLSSPHVYFYNEKNLRTLLARYQFSLVEAGPLKALSSEGMYQRVRSTYSPAPALVISAAATLFAWTAALFPTDVAYFLFKKDE